MFSWCPQLTRNSYRTRGLQFESLEDRITPVLYFTTDLAITQTFSPDPVAIGQQVTFEMTITNNGLDPVSSFTVSTSELTEVENATFIPSTGTYNQATGLYTLPTPLTSGNSVTLTLTGSVAATATGPLENIAVVSGLAGLFDTNSANNTSELVVPVITDLADLSITKDNDTTTDTLPTDGSFTYTIVVTNDGPADVTGAQVTDLFPDELTNITWTAAASTGSAVTDAAGTGDIDTTVDLLDGGAVTFTVNATADTGVLGAVSNTATVTAPDDAFDPDPTNNSATDELTVLEQADLTITKTNDVSNEAIAGETVMYTILVTNDGPTDVTGAAVTDAFPSNLTNVTWTAAASAGSSVTDATGTGDIDTTVDLLNGGDATFTVTATIASTLTAGNVIVNSANVTAPTDRFDPDLTNNQSNDSITVTASGDLAITKVNDTGDDIVVGLEEYTYTILVTNTGNDPAIDAPVMDTFPAGLTAITWTAAASAGSSVADATGTGDIDTTVTLLPGGDATFTVNVTVEAAFTGDIDNTATVTAPANFTDTDLTNNSALDEVFAQLAP